LQDPPFAFSKKRRTVEETRRVRHSRNHTQRVSTMAIHKAPLRISSEKAEQLRRFVTPPTRDPAILTLAQGEDLCIQALPYLDWTEHSERKMREGWGRIVSYSEARGITVVARFTRQLAMEWFEAPTPRTGKPPTSPTMQHRRWTLRAYFWILRQLNVNCEDPSLDLDVPARERAIFRPLTDDEVDLCRAVSLTAGRHAPWSIAWAMAETGGTHSELDALTWSDLDLQAGLVHLPGTLLIEGRDVLLNDWQTQILTSYVQKAMPDPAELIFAPGHPRTRHVIPRIFGRAGLTGDPLLRTFAVRAWVGNKAFRSHGRIDLVAKLLGLHSLDAAAQAIGWYWLKDSASS